MSLSELRRVVAASPRWTVFRRASWVALVPGSLLFAWLQWRGYVELGMIGADSHAYWLAAKDPSSWYTRPPATWDAYLYSPAFAQALWPFGRLPWPVFQVLWVIAQVGVLAWLLRPLGWFRALVLIPFLTGELALGNLYVFFGAVLVLAVSGAPGTLALPLLTKVTPSVVGLWFVLRGQWRAALGAIVFSGLVVAVSAALNPTAWLRWLEFLSESSNSGRGHSTMIRLAISIAVVALAARTNRSWLLAPALILACPVLDGWSYLAVLSALPRLLARDRRERLGSAGGVGHEQDEAFVASHDRPAPVSL